MSGGLKIETFTDPGQLECLRHIWKELATHFETDMDFFLRVIALRPEYVAPRILLARCDDTPLALLVGRLEKTILRPGIGYVKLPSLPVRRIVFACHGSNDLTVPVAEAIVEAIMARLRSGEADFCLLSNLSPAGALYASARRLPLPVMRDLRPTAVSRWRLRLPGTYEAFMKSLNGSKRSKLRRSIKHFHEEFGPAIRYRVFEASGDVDAFCADADRIASKTYQRGLGVGFLNDAESAAQLSTAAALGWLRAMILYVNDRPVAFWQGILKGNVYYCQTTGYDPAFRKHTVGIILLLKMIEGLCGYPEKTIDFGKGEAQYKEEFGNDHAEEAEVTVYAPALRGIVANVLSSATLAVNESITVLLKKLGLLTRIKNRWRKRLAQEVLNGDTR
jgi:hypothetical protein